MAAALLQHALAAEPEPLKSLRVISAGVAARDGVPVSAHAVSALQKVGIDISGHRAQALTPRMLEEAFVVLCMTESHRALICLQNDSPPRHLHLFREFIPDESEREIADPFGGPLKIYEAARDEMVEAIPSLIGHLRKLAAAGPSA